MATYGFIEIPLLDSSGLLDPTVVPARFDGFADTLSFAYTDFQPASPIGASTMTIDLGTLPAGYIITKVTVKHTTAFAGTSLATATVSIGVAGATKRITPSFDVKQATGNTKCQTTYGAIGFDSASSTTLKVTLDTTGMTNGIDDLTAGAFDVCIEMVKAPTAMAGGDHWFRLGRGPSGAASIFWRPDDFSTGDLVRYDSTLAKFTGTPLSGLAPASSEYLVLTLDSTLTNERQLQRGYHVVPVDGGPGSTYIQDVQYFGHDVHEIFDDFLTVNNPIKGFFNSFASGIAATVVATAAPSTRAGVIRMTLGTAATGRAGVKTDYVCYLASNGSMIFETAIQLSALANLGTPNSFFVRAGFGDSDNADFTDGIYFEYDLNNSANWRYCTANGGARTKNNSTTAVSTNWTRLKIVVNAAGTSAEFFVDGTSVGTQTTNIPTAGGNEFGALIHIVRDSGSTSVDLDSDYIGLRKVFDTARSADWPR